MINTEHDVGIHLDEAAIGVVGEARVGRAPRQAFDGLVVEAEIEDRIHHARHRGAPARADRHEKRIFDIAKARAGGLAHGIERGIDHGLQFVGKRAAKVIISGTDFGRNGEAWRHA